MTALGRFLRSVRGRITVISTALVAITLALASLLLVRLVQADLLTTAEQALDAAVQEQAELLGFDEFDAADPYQGFDVEIDGSIVELGLFTIDSDGLANGQLLIDDIPVMGLRLDPDSGEVVDIYELNDSEPLDPELAADLESLLFEVVEFADLGEEGGPQVLVGARPLDEIEESIEALRRALLLIVPVLVSAFGLLTWLLVGRALRPVVSITEQVQAISSSSLDRRVPVPDSTDEVAEMATVMNRMLERLERGDERQRQFSADASHELRSPLATVRAAAEILGRHPTPDRAAALADDIVAETERMESLIGDLLELARLDEAAPYDPSGPGLDEVDLTRVLRDELADEPIELHLPERLTAPVAPNRFRRLVRNLVDNARRHADDRVVVTLDRLAEADDGREGVRLVVDDDGSGVPDAAKELIFERFRRLDEARGRDAGGSGLGLALVASIAEHHGGTVTVERSPLGGARFVVLLPVIGEPGG